jgi:acetyltransferase-like isoleucine patch superfamily enzyme
MGVVFARGLRTIYRVSASAGSRWRIATLRARYPGLSISGSTIAPGCHVVCTLGSTMVIEGCTIARDVTIIADHGAVLELKAEYVGRGSVIVARERIEIGRGTEIAENVVVRDQDHRMPLSSQEHEVDPIRIGAGVWLGAGVVVLRGSQVGDQAVIGANAVVRTNVEPDSLYVGVPAVRAR